MLAGVVVVDLWGPRGCTCGDKRLMTAKDLVCLIEEMMDLKIQQFAESTMKPTPEVARILREKKETDRRRLEQIRTELLRFLEA